MDHGGHRAPRPVKLFHCNNQPKNHAFYVSHSQLPDRAPRRETENLTPDTRRQHSAANILINTAPPPASRCAEEHGYHGSVCTGNSQECICSSGIGQTDAALAENQSPLQVGSFVVTDCHSARVSGVGTGCQLKYCDANIVTDTAPLLASCCAEEHGFHGSVCTGNSQECICSSEVGQTDAALAENQSPLQVGSFVASDSQCQRSSGVGTGRQLKVYYQNVRGLRTKIDELFVAASEGEYDIIVLTETWLNETINSLQLFGSRYTVYRQDRDPLSTGKFRGGGTLIAVSNHLSSKRKLDIGNDLEQLWVSVCINNTSVCVGVVYIPPDSADNVIVIQKHIDSVLDIVSSLAPQSIHLLFGDYNQPGLIWKSTSFGHALPDVTGSTFTRSSMVLLDGMSLANMVQMSTVANMRNRTLDLVFINDDASMNCEISEAYEPLVDKDFHHPPLLTLLACPQLTSYDEIVEENQFNFSKTNFVQLQSSLQDIDWDSLLSCTTDVNAAVEIFSRTLKQQFAHCVPAPQPRAKPPWSNRRLQKLKRMRANALRQYSKQRNLMLKRKFTQASNNYRACSRFLYSRYVRRTQSNLKRNPKRFWSFVNEKRKENGLPSNMSLGNETANTRVSICNLFAAHFSSVFRSVPSSSSQIESALRDVPYNVINLSTMSFTENDILIALGKLKSSTAAGPDGIPAIVLKKCATILCTPLKLIFNRSITQAVFPECWKNSVMFPIFKKGDKQDVANYRGITSLCAGSKLFEILIGNVLLRGAKAYISVDQHGFFPGRSTTTNLVQFCSQCIKSMEDGDQVDTIYTDLKAAFDRVDHDILLAKIERLGAPRNFVKWLRSYLVGRSLSVKLGSVESQPFVNLSGVPQGSNLGPLLFSIFFNDVFFVIPPGCKLSYADDLKLFSLIRSTVECIELQQYLDAFTSWCQRNLLSLSVSKCSVISFTRRKKPILWNYAICQEPLERVSVVKDLGVLLDSQMSFRDHYSHIIAKANKNLGFIMRIAKELTDPYCLRALYFALVRSILETSSIVWSPYTDIWISRIESVQAKFLRYALRRLPWRDPTMLPPYADRCRLLDMDTLAKRRNMSRAIFVGRLMTDQIDAPNILSKINVLVPLRNFRSWDFLRLDYQRTYYGQNEPIRAMCEAFNSVYELFDFNVSIDVFRNRLRRLT